jgi:hypothetical protein
MGVLVLEARRSDFDFSQRDLVARQGQLPALLDPFVDSPAAAEPAGLDSNPTSWKAHHRLPVVAHHIQHRRSDCMLVGLLPGLGLLGRAVARQGSRGLSRCSMLGKLDRDGCRLRYRHQLRRKEESVAGKHSGR